MWVFIARMEGRDVWWIWLVFPMCSKKTTISSTATRWWFWFLFWVAAHLIHSEHEWKAYILSGQICYDCCWTYFHLLMFNLFFDQRFGPWSCPTSLYWWSPACRSLVNVGSQGDAPRKGCECGAWLKMWPEMMVGTTQNIIYNIYIYIQNITEIDEYVCTCTEKCVLDGSWWFVQWIQPELSRSFQDERRGKVAMRFVPKALRDYFLARCFTRCLLEMNCIINNCMCIYNYI